MTWSSALDIILDALKDSVLVFAFVFIFYFIISLFENQIANFLVKRKWTAPIFGSLFGVIPQCGTSVLGADLYIRKYITLGTLIAIFLSCSDEALIVLLSSGNQKAIMVLPLIGIKFVVGLIFGVAIDLIFFKQKIVKVTKVDEPETCEHHHHENTASHKHLFHPLVHSLEIFIYVLVINLILGFVIGFIGEENFANFISASKYLSPLFGSIIGLIPNCASSIILSQLYVEGGLSFGALVAGLLVNSGLGIMMLLKNKRTIKIALLILLICFVISIVSGYIICLITGF